MMRSLQFIALLITTSMLHGCASNQLRRTTPQHCDTLADIYEQQVLDNMAKFCSNPGSTPSFAVPQSGTNGIAHSNAVDGGLNFNPTTLTSSRLGLSGSRQHTLNWTIRAVNDPVRLDLMKCVFQYVTCRQDPDCCSDCVAKLERFFDKDLSPCKLPRGFFAVEDKKHVRLSNCCEKTGEYCGVLVTVPARHFDQLSRLTLAILDIATLSNEDLAKRMNGKQAEKVLVTEKFDVIFEDGVVRQITGTYSLDVKDYQELQSGNKPDSVAIQSAQGEDSSDENSGAAGMQGNQESKGQIFSPAEIFNRSGERRLNEGSLYDLESQIQSTLQSPLNFVPLN